MVGEHILEVVELLAVGGGVPHVRIKAVTGLRLQEAKLGMEANSNKGHVAGADWLRDLKLDPKHLLASLVSDTLDDIWRFVNIWDIWTWGSRFEQHQYEMFGSDFIIPKTYSSVPATCDDVIPFVSAQATINDDDDDDDEEGGERNSEEEGVTVNSSTTNPSSLVLNPLGSWLIVEIGNNGA